MRLQSNLYLILILLALTSISCKHNGHENAPDAVSPSELKDSVLISGLSYPWEILWGPDQHIWMTERGGRVSRVDPATGQSTLLLNITEVVSNGEGGLLGMVLHPDFPSTPTVYVAYDYNQGSEYREKVVAFTYNGTTLLNPITLIDSIHASSIHNGCRLAIGPDRKLYITTGDASDQSRPLNKQTVNGKILRLNLDGTVPSDNPEPGNPYWTYGHRNPQGLVFVNNVLYSSEHGPDSDDEVNIIEKGLNYGWPSVRGYCNTSSEQSYCSANPVKEPLEAWTPTAAVCGLDYYNNDLIPQWKNSLLLVSLKNTRLYQLKLDQSGKTIAQTNEYFNNKYGRLRDLCIAPSGKVYLCTSNGGDDKIIVVDKR